MQITYAKNHCGFSTYNCTTELHNQLFLTPQGAFIVSYKVIHITWACLNPLATFELMSLKYGSFQGEFKKNVQNSYTDTYV